MEFEKRYGALILSHLLTGDPVSELGDDATVTSVWFQARAESAVDDLLIVGRGGDGADRRSSVAVRHKPKLILSDDLSVDLLASYLSLLTEHWDEVHAGRWRLALVAAPTTPVGQLAALAAIAEGLPDNRRFRDAVARQGRTTHEVRQRLERLDPVVSAACERTNVGGVDHTELTWRFLSSLTVRQLKVEPPDDSDRTATVGRLRSSTVGGTATEADRLLAAITDLVGRYVPAAAEVNEAMLRSDLVGSADLRRSSRHPAAWGNLEALRTRLRGRTSSHLEDLSGNTLELDRESALADLVDALCAVGSRNADTSSTLVISGEPDVGKSALTLRAVEAAEGAGAAIIAVSLRDLRSPTADTEQYLGAPLEEILAGLDVRPVRLLVVDGAEAALEGREDLLGDLTTAALNLNPPFWRAGGCWGLVEGSAGRVRGSWRGVGGSGRGVVAVWGRWMRVVGRVGARGVVLGCGWCGRFGVWGVLGGSAELGEVADVGEGGVEGGCPGPAGGEAQDGASAVVDEASG